MYFYFNFYNRKNVSHVVYVAVYFFLGGYEELRLGVSFRISCCGIGGRLCTWILVRSLLWCYIGDKLSVMIRQLRSIKLWYSELDSGVITSLSMVTMRVVWRDLEQSKTRELFKSKNLFVGQTLRFLRRTRVNRVELLCSKSLKKTKTNIYYNLN